MHATNVAQLEDVTSEIHDCWFDVDSIQYDRESGRVRIPFALSGKKSLAGSLVSKPSVGAQSARRVLEIRNVEELQLDDVEKVGSYDFNKLTYLPEARTLVVLTGIPLRLEARVVRIDVAILDE